MRSGFAAIRSVYYDDRTLVVDEREAPRIGFSQAHEGQDTIPKLRVTTARGQQARYVTLVGSLRQVIPDRASASFGLVFKELDQCVVPAFTSLFEFAKRRQASSDIGTCFQLQRGAMNMVHGALKKALVDMPDLLYVERAVRERLTFERLDGFEQQENGSIVDRQWICGLGPPSRASLAAL